jgi:hypothetical protein
MDQKRQNILAGDTGKKVLSFSRIADALNDEERLVIMALLTSARLGNGYSIAGIREVTGIANADIHVAVLEKVGLIRPKRGKKEEIFYETNYIWCSLLREWLKFRKEQAHERCEKEGNYP